MATKLELNLYNSGRIDFKFYHLCKKFSYEKRGENFVTQTVKLVTVGKGKSFVLKSIPLEDIFEWRCPINSKKYSTNFS